MDESYPIERKSPREKANCLSKLCFFWMSRICYEGCTAELELSSLYSLQEHDKSAKLANKFEKIWEEEIERGKRKNKRPSLLRALCRMFLLEYFLWGILIFINVVIVKSLQPLMLSGLILLFVGGDYTALGIAYYAGGLAFLTIISAFMYHHTNCGTNLIGMRARIAVSSILYRKILRLSQLSLGKTSAGHVVNLLSNDVARFDVVVMGLNYFWIGPLQIVIVSVLMWLQMGPGSMAAVITIILTTLPLQLIMGSITSKYRMKVAVRTDYRVEMMGELLAGVQVIKMYAWETPFEYYVAESRKDEVKWLTRTSYVRGVLSSFQVFVEKATLCASLVCFVLLGRRIRADLVFSLLMYIDLLNLTLSMIMPIAIAMTAESLISIERLEDFLLMEEKETIKIVPSEDKSIFVRNVNASWIPNTAILKNLEVKLEPGTLCAVIGPVGSGKSSFLKLLLGEIPTTSGTVEYSGEISYASQEPWLFSSTVRSNILFGEQFERMHYRTIVRCCALERDFELLPDGDKTKVGDRGVSLSGGQRARINLARSVYKDSDIYLLDDPLSAVDTKVGRHLFDKCIMGYLKGKTRILVTHQLQYLKKADIIIVFNKGSIEAQGTFDELSRSDLDFTKLLVAADESEEHERTEKLKRVSTLLLSSAVSLAGGLNDEAQRYEDMEDKSGYKGSASFAYLNNMGGCPIICFMLFLFVFCEVLYCGTDYWMTFWATQEELRYKADLSNTPAQLSRSLKEYSPEMKTMQPVSNITATISYFILTLEKTMTDRITLDGKEHIVLKTSIMMYIFILIIVVLVIGTQIETFVFFYCSMQASIRLHNKMFHCLLEAPMRFFDTNPAGRVLNRFSKDMGAIDELLPKALIDVIQILLIMCGILVMVLLSIPYITVALIVLGVIFLLVRHWYISTARAIKLIEGVAKSPVFSYLSSSIDGLTTIRASKNEEVLMRQFDNHQDVHTSSWYLKVLTGVAFGLWLDLICVVFVCFVIGGFIILDQFTDVEGSFLGLGISQSSLLVGMLQFGMRQIAEVVNYLTSVERILEYTQLEKEQPLYTSEDMKPEEPWPNKGRVVFENMTLKYIATDPPVINNLSLEVLPAEKIGIVGRTGAGKSSLIAALFRLAPLEGKIWIDDIDTGTLGLRDLRKKISIIPQEPVLFSATMRYNLDPFNENSDEDLWNALEEVELKNDIDSLDYMITEGGNNFSVGQRQLVCLARAILRDNRIIILDEATANVDPKTDLLIQTTIRKKFKDRTVLTVAHRLNTIMDSDKVLVMDSGCKVEFDHAHILLQNPDGYFTKMLNETGPSMTQILRTIAEESYRMKQQTENEPD